MNTMERLHLFSTRRTRERSKHTMLRTNSSSETARIADFQSAQRAMRIAQDEAAAMSSDEKSAAQSRSSAERLKVTPAV
jgi:hypothetical protein